jgi:hypothetical protein
MAAPALNGSDGTDAFPNLMIAGFVPTLNKSGCADRKSVACEGLRAGTHNRFTSSSAKQRTTPMARLKRNPVTRSNPPGDQEMRAFFRAMGISSQTIDRAIQMRLNAPTEDVGEEATRRRTPANDRAA